MHASGHPNRGFWYAPLKAHIATLPPAKQQEISTVRGFEHDFALEDAIASHA
jgi:hypothetical protein